MKKLIFIFMLLLAGIGNSDGQIKISKFTADVIYAPHSSRTLYCCEVIPDHLKQCFCNKLIKVIEQSDTDARGNENECGWIMNKTKVEDGNYKVSIQLIGGKREAMMIIKALKKSTTVAQVFDIKELE